MHSIQIISNMKKKTSLVPCRCSKCTRTIEGHTLVTTRTRRRHYKKDSDQEIAASASTSHADVSTDKSTSGSLLLQTDLDLFNGVSHEGGNDSSSPTIVHENGANKTTDPLASIAEETHVPRSKPPDDFPRDAASHDDFDPGPMMDFDDPPFYPPSHSSSRTPSRPSSPPPFFPSRPSSQNDNRHSNPGPPPEQSRSNDSDIDRDDEHPPENLVENTTELVPAFKQIPALRLLYLQVAIAHIKGSSTVSQATDQLQDGLDLIALCGNLPTFPAPRRSLVTVKKDLGLQVDDFIIKMPICDICYKCYSFAEIQALDSPHCKVPRCPGTVYRTKRPIMDESDAPERVKRAPSKYLTYCPLIKALQRFLLRSSFIKNLRDTSQDLGPRERSEDTIMQDIYDGTEWTMLELGLKRIFHPDGSVEDVENSPGSRRPFFSCDLGLSVTLNLDWFGLTDNRPYSAGAVYISFNNLHRSVRYLAQNVHLAMVIPGPKEPSLESLNHCLEPLKDELHELYKGVYMRVHGFRRLRDVHVGLLCENSDIPATRKLVGAASHSHRTHPCNYCLIILDDIDRLTAYDIQNFRMRDDWDQLKHAAESKTAITKAAKKAILDTHGVRFSVLNELPGWFPIRRSPLDFMHNFYALVKRFIYDVVTAGYLLDSAGWELYEATIRSIIWPSNTGRLPQNLNDDHALPKADQWRHLSNILPFVLWVCWRDPSGNIRSSAPRVPSNSKKRPTFQRNMQIIYKLSLYLAVSERILATRSISVADVERGQAYLQLYCQGLQSLGVHQTINSHLAMHYSTVFRRYGPAYATWLFGFERFNGVLEDVNLNGHGGGEMEYSLARDWIEKHRLYELAISLPEEASPQERKVVERVITQKGINRGTLGNQIAGFVSESIILAPRRSSKGFHDLRCLQHPEVYGLVISFLQLHFPELHICDDMTTDAGGTVVFADRSIKVLPFIIKDGIRFGSATTAQTSSDRFAAVTLDDTHHPCKLVYHFEVHIPNRETLFYCSAIQKMVYDEEIPSMPWDILYMVSATELDATVVYGNEYSALEIIPSSSLSYAVAIIPIPQNPLAEPTKPFWVVTSCDRNGSNNDEGWLDLED